MQDPMFLMEQMNCVKSWKISQTVLILKMRYLYQRQGASKHKQQLSAIQQELKAKLG